MCVGVSIEVENYYSGANFPESSPMNTQKTQIDTMNAEIVTPNGHHQVERDPEGEKKILCEGWGWGGEERVVCVFVKVC